MTEDDFIKAQELFERQNTLKKCINNSLTAKNWHELIINFERAGMPDYLGKFGDVKADFVNKITDELYDVNKEIESI